MSKLSQITTPLQQFKGHEAGVTAVVVLPDKRRMVTGTHDKTLRLWDQPIKAHTKLITSLCFSPDGTVLATGSFDSTSTLKLWDTKTWQDRGNLEVDAGYVRCAQYSPSGELLAIATSYDIQIYNSDTRKRVALLKGHIGINYSLAWTPDGTRLLTGGHWDDPTIREWDTTTWQQVGDPWMGHTNTIKAIAINPASTLVASASYDNHVRLWRLSERRTIVTFKHSFSPECVIFSVDGKHILAGGKDKMISGWAVPNSKILAITTARNPCIHGDLSTAEELLTQDINTDVNNHTSYAHRSFVMARKHDWDRALRDAINSISIRPSLTGYISKGIALCGKGHIRDARAAFDVASMYTDQDSETIYFLLLIKATALFNADQHDEANLLLKELAAGCPNADARACHIVEAYLRFQLGIKALDGAHYDEAANHFNAAVNSSTLSSNLDIHLMCEDLVVLFGWDLKSLWLTAHQKHCYALLWAGKIQDAVKSYQYIIVSSDENTLADCLGWFNEFKKECSVLCFTNGDAALAASNYDKAIDLYSAAVDLNCASDVVFANRSKAKLGKMLWEDALLDAQMVIQLNPSSHVGYQLTHTALHGMQHYGEAIDAFKIMLSRLDDALETQIRDLRQQYVSPFEVEDTIRKAVWIELENTPLRLLNTSTGLLCNRTAQMNSFKTSLVYKELLSSTTKHSDLQTERIKDVVATYFRCVLLSHRWEETEALLHDIQDKDVYELGELGGIVKLQSFCKIARDAGYCWAWMDTCCIDKNSNAELQESINSMFVWYRHSALTIVYLCDVPPSSQPGALARSVWNERGWTFQEFVAPRVVIFYQKDWSLYLGDRSSNHKESPAIMKELEVATGIDAWALISFRAGMSNARQRLQWASSRVTTLQEDIAYSLFGIFGIHLPVIYGEKRQNALGRLLQEIVARSGDVTVLDWIGQPSEFNSCLPAHITSYTTPPRTHPFLSEDQILTTISLLRKNPAAVAFALKLYDQLDNTSAARFANCRLHLPCMAFRVTEVSLSYGPSQEIQYEVKADGLHDLLITTNEPIVRFSRSRPTQQTFVLVRPWDRSLLELPDFADLIDGMESEGEFCAPPSSPSDDSPSRSLVKQEVVDLESRALRLLVRLGQPFGAFLLARQRGGEYKRVSSDHDIVARVVEDVTSIRDLMDIRTIEIL